MFIEFSILEGAIFNRLQVIPIKCCCFVSVMLFLFCVLYQVIGIIPFRLLIRCIVCIATIIQVILEQGCANLSEVSELDFLNDDLHRVLNPVSVDYDTEVRFVIEVRRTADVIQGGGFDYSVLILGLLCGVCHQNNKNVILLREIGQLI